MEDYDDLELEEMEKTYPQYDDMNDDDLTTNLVNLERKVKGEAMYGSDPLVIVDLKSELDYVKLIMERRTTEETTFTEGNDGTVNISGPSGSTTVPGVEFVDVSDVLLPDVLAAYDDTFDAEWEDIEERLKKLGKLPENRLTAELKRNFENQVERVQAVVRVIKGKEKLLLDPKNKYVRELIKRSSVKTLKDGTEVLMFRSEQGIDKGGTQIMKRGKTSELVYSRNSPALREYKDLLKKIKEIREDSDTGTEGGESNPDVSDLVSRITESIAGIVSLEGEQLSVEEYNSSEEYASRENIELIDMGAHLGDLPGLTIAENNELRGVLSPPEGSDLEGRTGQEGALQIQAEYFNKAIGETVERASAVEGVSEYDALMKRIDSLKEARDQTLKQRVVEEAREEQLKDISRLRRFIDWVGKEKVGLAGLAVSTAALVTTLVISARGAVVTTARATGKVSKALAELAKKAGPILLPILSALATALKYGALWVAWIASNLWVLAVAIAATVYSYNNR
jgi:hypothetical protein